MEPSFINQNPYSQRVNTDIGRERNRHTQLVVARVIELAGGILISLLAIRFVFMLMGANRASGLASFVYGFTAPFVLPFSGLFNYDHFSYGESHFEGFTLVAIGFYALIVAGLRKLVTIASW